MSKKGGYVIVDLKGQSITAGTPFTLDGVTARLDRAKNKACLLSGFAIGDEEKRDVFVDLQKTEDGYAGTIDGYQITIEDDEVTFTADEGLVIYSKIVSKTGQARDIAANSVLTLSFEGDQLDGDDDDFTILGTIVNGSNFSTQGLVFSMITHFEYRGYYVPVVMLYIHNITSASISLNTSDWRCKITVIKK